MSNGEDYPELSPERIELLEALILDAIGKGLSGEEVKDFSHLAFDVMADGTIDRLASSHEMRRSTYKITGARSLDEEGLGDFDTRFVNEQIAIAKLEQEVFGKTDFFRTVLCRIFALEGLSEDERRELLDQVKTQIGGEEFGRIVSELGTSSELTEAIKYERYIELCSRYASQVRTEVEFALLSEGVSVEDPDYVLFVSAFVLMVTITIAGYNSELARTAHLFVEEKAKSLGIIGMLSELTEKHTT